MLAVKFDIGEGDGGRRTNFLVLFLTSPPPSFAPLSLSLSDATRVIPGTLGAKEPSPGFDDDGGRLSGKIGRDVGLANGKSGSGGNRYFDRSSTPDLPEPYFDATSPRNVSALVGKTAFLTCVVRNLGKAKSVSTTTIPNNEIDSRHWFVRVGECQFCRSVACQVHGWSIEVLINFWEENMNYEGGFSRSLTRTISL